MPRRSPDRGQVLAELRRALGRWRELLVEEHEELVGRAASPTTARRLFRLHSHLLQLDLLGWFLQGEYGDDVGPLPPSHREGTQ